MFSINFRIKKTLQNHTYNNVGGLLLNLIFYAYINFHLKPDSYSLDKDFILK